MPACPPLCTPPSTPLCPDPTASAPSRSGVNLLVCLLTGAVLSLGLSGAARATLECELPDDRRQLRVELPGADHLCEVSVTYQSGERRVLWYADNDSLFCSAKLDDLEEKYTGEWGFACGPWPSSDGIDALTPKQRRALDRELLARLDGRIAPTGVRVATASLGEEGLLVAVQWLAETGDALSIYRDTTAAVEPASWQPLAEIDDLNERLPRSEGSAAIERTLLTGVDDAGALAVTTIVVDEQEPGSVCRGRQRLALDPQGELIALTPHRHACEAIDG